MKKEKIKKTLIHLTWISLAIAISQSFITKRGGIPEILLNALIAWSICSVVAVLYLLLTGQRSNKPGGQN